MSCLLGKAFLLGPTPPLYPTPVPQMSPGRISLASILLHRLISVVLNFVPLLWLLSCSRTKALLNIQKTLRDSLLQHDSYNIRVTVMFSFVETVRGTDSLVLNTSVLFLSWLVFTGRWLFLVLCRHLKLRYLSTHSLWMQWYTTSLISVYVFPMTRGWLMWDVP